MTRRNSKLKLVRVFLLEDEPRQAEERRGALLRIFGVLSHTGGRFEGCDLEVRVVGSTFEMEVALADTHFHFLLLDLRVPVAPGHPLTVEAKGLEEFARIRRLRGSFNPACIAVGAALSQYAGEHLSAAVLAGGLDLEYWQKAAADVDSTAATPRLDSDLTARFVLERLQPFGPAMHQMLGNLIGLLPRSAAGAAQPLLTVGVKLADWITARADPVKEGNLVDAAAAVRSFNRDALWSACRLGEMAKEWLFAVVAAHMSTRSGSCTELRQFVCASDVAAAEAQERKEELLDAMLSKLVGWSSAGSLGASFLINRLFSHLDIAPADRRERFAFIRHGLKELRAVRNELAHWTLGESLEAQWARIANPLWRIIDALAFFGSHALVTNIRAAAPGYVQVQRFQSLRQEEHQVALHCVGKDAYEWPSWHADPRQAYVLWPRVGSSAHDLLPLWPWVARLSSSRNAPLKTYFYVGRSDKGHPIGLAADTWSLETLHEGEAARRWRQALDGCGVSIDD